MANGVLEDRVMDERGVPKAEDEVNNKDRDDRVPRSNRCKMLAGQEVLIYFKNKREEKNAMKLQTRQKKVKKIEKVLKDQLKESKQESRDTKAKLTNSNKKVRELKERSIIYETQNQSSDQL